MKHLLITLFLFIAWAIFFVASRIQYVKVITGVQTADSHKDAKVLRIVNIIAFLLTGIFFLWTLYEGAIYLNLH